MPHAQTLNGWWRTMLACGVLALAGFQEAGCRTRPDADSAVARADESVRVLAWNVSSDAFVRDAATFKAVLTRADADILLFDEVRPTTTETQLRAALAGRARAGSDGWHIASGQSGGRQRGVIASRQPTERLPELSEGVPYPVPDRDRI